MSTSVQPEPFDPDSALATYQHLHPAAESTAAPFDPDEALAAYEKQAKGPLTPEQQTPAQSFFDNAGNAVAFGQGPKIAGALGAVGSLVQGKGLSGYEPAKTAAEGQLAQDQSAHGAAAALGGATGAALSPINLLAGGVGGGAARMAGLGRLGQAAAGGAASGALYGAGTAPPGEAGRGAVTGGVTGALAAPAADFALGKLAPTVGRAAQHIGFGKPLPTGQEAYDAVQAARGAQGATAYPRAEALPDITKPEIIAEIQNEPHFREAWQDAREIGRVRGLNIPDLPTPAAEVKIPKEYQGNPQVIAAIQAAHTQQQAISPTGLPIAGINLMKQGLDNYIERSSTPAPLANALRTKLRGVLDQVDAIAPEYAAARQGWQQHSQLMDAIEPTGAAHPPSVSPWLAASAATGHPVGLMGTGLALLKGGSPGIPAGAAQAVDKLAPSLTRVSPDVLGMARQVAPKPYLSSPPIPTSGAGPSLLSTFTQQRMQQADQNGPQ